MNAERLARSAHLLEIQGQLIDAHLVQNMGERYGYVLIVFPVRLPGDVQLVTNVDHPLVDDFGDMLRAELTPHPVTVGHASVR